MLVGGNGTFCDGINNIDYYMDRIDNNGFDGYFCDSIPNSVICSLANSWSDKISNKNVIKRLSFQKGGNKPTGEEFVIDEDTNLLGYYNNETKTFTIYMKNVLDRIMALSDSLYLFSNFTKLESIDMI